MGGGALNPILSLEALQIYNHYLPITKFSSIFLHVHHEMYPLHQLHGEQRAEYNGLGNDIITFLNSCSKAIAEDSDKFDEIANNGRMLIHRLSEIRRNEMKHIRNTSASKKVDLVYITLLQESQAIIAHSIHLVRINAKFQHS